MEAADYNKMSWQQRRTMRKLYVKEQQGVCIACRASLDGPTAAEFDRDINMRLFPRGFLDHPVHLHHCHSTGKTVGAVHAKCNGILWQYYGE